MAELRTYRRKRDFTKTDEPEGGSERTPEAVEEPVPAACSASRSTPRRACTTTCGWSSTASS